MKGNGDEKSLGELHRQVWPFVQKEFDRIIEQEKARCDELLGTAMASNDMKAVVLSSCARKNRHALCGSRHSTAGKN